MELERKVKWDKKERTFEVEFTLRGEEFKEYKWFFGVNDLRFEKIHIGDPYTLKITAKNEKEIENITKKVIKGLKRLKTEDKTKEEVAKNLTKTFVIE